VVQRGKGAEGNRVRPCSYRRRPLPLEACALQEVAYAAVKCDGLTAWRSAATPAVALTREQVQ